MLKYCFLLLTILSQPCFGKESEVSYPEGAISDNAVLPPMNTYLLVRNGDQLCALKISEIWRGNDRTEGTPFRGGDESFRARYTWYAAEKESGKWRLNPPSAYGEGKLSKGPLVGIGRFAFGGGNRMIKCGPIELEWTAPAWVYFSYPLGREQGNEFAITVWKRLEDIDPNDGGLEWLQFDKKRLHTPILPGK